MILRRFMKHVADQNWFAVGLDVLVVIVGIFLGLQVQAWYDRQNDLEEERRVVGYLITDIENTISRLDNAVRLFGVVIQHEEKLLQFLEQDTLAESDIEPFEEALFMIGKNPPIEGFFNGFNPENLSKIQNEQLKRTIGRYIDSKNTVFNLVDMIYRKRFPNTMPKIMNKALISQETSIGILKHYDFDQLKIDNDYKMALGYMLNDTIVLQSVVRVLSGHSQKLHEVFLIYQEGNEFVDVDFQKLM